MRRFFAFLLVVLCERRGHAAFLREPVADRLSVYLPANAPLDLLNKQPALRSTEKQTLIRNVYVHPLAKFRTRKAIAHLFGLRYQHQDRSTLFEFYNAKHQHHAALFPLTDDAALQLSTHYDHIRPQCQTTMPRHQMEMVLNKTRFMRWLGDNGFRDNVPQTYANSQAVQQFPVVVKLASNTTASTGVFVAHTLQQLESITEQLGERDVLVQEFVPGNKERIVHFVAIQGRMVRMVCHERVLLDPIYQFTLHSAQYRLTPPQVRPELCHYDLFRSLVSKLNFTGIGNFDVKLSPDNRVKIFECNPRVPGTILRHPRLMAEFLCAMQWNGNGVVNPNTTQGGCVHNVHGETTLVSPGWDYK